MSHYTEGFDGGDEVEPTIEACADFDWASVERAFGELRDDPEQRDRLAAVLRFVFDWMLRGNLRRMNALHVIGKRAVAMAWVIDPARFNNDSLRSIAMQLGCTAGNISPLTAEFSRLTGITNVFKAHDWRKDKPEHEKTDGH